MGKVSPTSPAVLVCLEGTVINSKLDYDKYAKLHHVSP